MKVRAKFNVQSITRHAHNTWDGSKNVIGEAQTIKLTAVYSDSNPENKKFFAMTPSATIDLTVVTKEVGDSFEIGKVYYVDFTPADAPAAG